MIKLLRDRNYRFICLSRRGFYNFMDDETYIKKRYYAEFGKTLNLNSPKTFNEKIQWLKLNDKNPKYPIYVDKYKVRDIIKNKLGEEYLIPLLGVWDKPEDIDYGSLPNEFVLKCNHNSGLGMCICKNKDKIDIKEIQKKLKRGLKENYYYNCREWPYKNIPHKIIAEKFMKNNNDNRSLIDYKFMCFNGEPRCILCVTDRFDQEGEKITFFDMNWKILPIKRKVPITNKKINKPLNFDKMVKFAKILSKNTTFIRVDFYEINGELYFGELTLYPGGGFEKFYPEEADYILGEWLHLPVYDLERR